MSTFSTHVLDIAHGRPAAGMTVRLVAGGWSRDVVTDADGRCPDLDAGDLPAGHYRLEFGVAAYFRGIGVALPDPPFLDIVAVDFGVAADGGHYHVPLLVSPFGYSTYRGS